jgi:hypothetical protein
MTNQQLDQLSINTSRTLSIDLEEAGFRVQKQDRLRI